MITYLIEVSICWLLFYGIYILLLRKETFFNINRWYLLSTLGLGLAIPIFSVDFTSLFYTEPASVVYLAEGFSELEYVIADSVEKAQEVDYSWLTLVKAIYFLGIFIAFFKFLYGFRQIYSLYRTGTVTQKGKYKLVLTEKPHLPFSFFNYLFWHKDTALEDTDSGKIITHELAHINQWHSLDVLFLETLGILLWFSPPIYWYKKSLRAVHEFLADAYVLRDTKKKQYGHLLIRQVQSGMQISLANNFIHSQLKQRINMMTRNQSRRKELMRYLPALPLLLLMVLVFSNKNVQHNLNETTAMASLAFEELSPNILTALIATEDVRFFTPEETKQELIDAYNKDVSINFVGVTLEKSEIKKMEDSRKMKNLHKACKALIVKYPDKEANIKALMKEVALENGYSVRFNRENMIYQSINPTQQNAAAELYKLLVVNGASVGNTKSIIPSSEIQKMETLSPQQAMERFGAENGKNGAVLIESDNWTVLESTEGATILVRKDAADLYDDGNHTIKIPNAVEMEQSFADTPPMFPGGEKEMLHFIYKNIKYPSEARQQGIYGNLTAQFIVEKDGSISNLKIKNDLGGGLKEEVLRVMKLVQEMPEKWTPAMKNGVATRSTYELPFEYHLESQNEDGAWYSKNDPVKVKQQQRIVIVGLSTTRKEVIKKADDKTEVEFEKMGKDGIAHYRTVGKDPNQPINPILKNKSINGEPVYKIVDKMPRFPGCGTANEYNSNLKNCGDEKMLRFIYENIKYPKTARTQGIEGTVVISFIVEKNGKINDGKILRNIGGGTGEEALRVVNLMKEKDIRWVPGIVDGEPVNFNFNLPVKFKLAPDAKQVEAGVEKALPEVKLNSENGVKPLIIVNGKAFKGDLKDVNPDDIASINVLKDEAAFKKYGDNGKNGVVEIQLKAEVRLEKIDDNGVRHYRTVGKSRKKSRLPSHTPSGEKIYNVVDRMPRFPGCGAANEYSEALKNCGDEKMLKFIYQNVKYPEVARKEGIEGTTVIRFLVESDGTINDAEILRNVGGGTGEEALRVVNLMKERDIKWIPGQQDGKKVNVNFNLPVKFKLADDVKEELARKKKEKGNIVYHPSARQIPIGYKDEALTFDALTLNVFPNPVQDQLSITIQGATKNALVTVFDITGKEFFREKLTAFDGTYHKTINLQNTTKGTLIVNVRHKGKDYQKKVVVQ